MGRSLVRTSSMVYAGCTCNFNISSLWDKYCSLSLTPCCSCSPSLCPCGSHCSLSLCSLFLTRSPRCPSLWPYSCSRSQCPALLSSCLFLCLWLSLRCPHSRKEKKKQNQKVLVRKSVVLLLMKWMDRLIQQDAGVRACGREQDYGPSM